MDARQQRDGEDSPLTNPRRPSDAPIYIFAVIATAMIVFGLFAWLEVDPLPPSRQTPETAETPGYYEP